MSQSLPYDETEFDKNVKQQDTLNTPNDSDIGFFIECDLKKPDNIKKAKKFSFCREKKLVPKINLVTM